MSPATALCSADEPAVPFPSLSALRSAHGELLKSHSAGGAAPEQMKAVESFLLRGQATGTLLDSPDDRWSAQSALDYWASTLYRLGRREVDPVLAEFDPALAPALDDALCPYVGLEAFREESGELFFGRARLVGEMLARLKETRLLAALGPSGSGKSSVALGGLVPALKAGALPGSEGWSYLSPMVPGSEPLQNLARALLPGGADPAQISRQAARLAKDPGHLARLAAERGDRPVVLVIDQFEELFTLCEDNRARQAFIASLLGLLETPAPRHRVILTMRSDYEAFVARLQDLQPFFERGQLRVTPLSAAELREAIERPAERVGLKFEDGVVPALLEDILGEPAGLPLLQFTLLKLWEHRERNRVTWAAYRRLGGGRLALAQSADAFYDGLIPEEQVTARRILLRMVRPGSGLEVTSNRVRRESLDRSGEDPGRVDRVLDKLVKARLVRLTPGETPADAQVEVAHEALVRNWPRLVDWLEEARAEITVRRRLEARAAEWVSLGRGQGGLLDEVQLLEAERWLESDEAADLGYDEQVAALVQASRSALDQAARDRRLRARLWRIAIAAAVLWALVWAMAYVRQTIEKNREIERANVEILKQKEAAEDSAHNARAAQARAEEEKRRADEAAEQADAARQEAEKEREKALAARDAAQRERARAEAAARQAGHSAQEALSRKEEAEVQTRLALQAREEAERERQNAEAEKKLAERKTAEVEEARSTLAQKTEVAETRWKELERELADGGGAKDPTLGERLSGTPKSVKREFDLRPFRRRHRPVQIGTSISTWQKGGLAGTICCLVRDAAGKEYLLSRSSVFSGISGSLVTQPSRRDGGTDAEWHIVAEVHRKGGNSNRSGAIARLLDGVAAEPVIPELGRIEGIADDVVVGTEVRSVGRGSGIQKGRVIRLQEDGTIVTDVVPEPGDTGGPVLTPDRRLIGMLWGWSERGRESYVAPIRQVLDELDVELVVR